MLNLKRDVKVRNLNTSSQFIEKLQKRIQPEAVCVKKSLEKIKREIQEQIDRHPKFKDIEEQILPIFDFKIDKFD